MDRDIWDRDEGPLGAVMQCSRCDVIRKVKAAVEDRRGAELR